MTGVRTVTLDIDEPEQRLDRWFRRRFPHVPQVRIEKLCRKGEIRVDGGRVRAATRVGPGHTIRVPPLPEAPERPAGDRPPVSGRLSEADARMIRATVIYRDDDVLAIDKPPGLPVQGGSRQVRHVDGMGEALRFGYDEPPRLVHRLDKDTSGVLLLARTRRAAGALAAAFRARETRKIYWAAVAGVPAPASGTVNYGLVKSSGRGTAGEAERTLCVRPSRIASTPGAKRAVTNYAVLARRSRRAAWVALEPVDQPADVAELRRMIKSHRACTGSTVAARLLADWPATPARFVKVMPLDYKRVLEQRAAERRAKEPRQAAGGG